MGRFYAEIQPTNNTLREFADRGLSKSIVWAPSRMIDAAEEMLASWQRNDTDNAPTHPAKLPVIIVALAKDYTPTSREFTRQVADKMLVILPDDEKERAFGLRVMSGDIRAQLAIFAHDEATARSLAAQFLLFIDATENRRFTSQYEFAGQVLEWPVQLESPDAPAMSIATEAKNLTILALDVVLKAQIPLFDAPKAGQPNDGKGTPNTDDPAGYPLVETIDITSNEGSPDYTVKIREYTVEDASDD